MIKKVIAGGNKQPIAQACLDVLNTLVKFGLDNEKLVGILKNLDK